MKHQRTIEQDVINFIKDNCLLNDAKKVLIGLSGGADSVFALHFFIKYKRKYKIDIVVLHVNHKLRGKEANSDEKFCRELCKKWNVDFFAVNVNVKDFVKKNKYSVEEAARILRYEQFEKFRKSTNSDLIVTAHNSNDNTETVLLNIVSGTGVKGIAGIPIKRENIIRPFLGVSKEDITNYLQQQNIDFVEDSTNLNFDFRRNYFRNEIIPKLKRDINPSLDKSILKSSLVYRNQAVIIDYFVNDAVQKIFSLSDQAGIISLRMIKNYPIEIWGELFKSILEKYFKITYSYEHYRKLRKIIDAQVGAMVELGDTFFAYRERGKIEIIKKYNSLTISKTIKPGDTLKIGKYKIKIVEVNPKKIKMAANPKLEYISGDNCGDEFEIRNWQKGDKIRLLGMKGTKKVSDVLTDLKVPAIDKKQQLVLTHNNEIVWIVGKKISDCYKITKETKRVLQLCLE